MLIPCSPLIARLEHKLVRYGLLLLLISLSILPSDAHKTGLRTWLVDVENYECFFHQSGRRILHDDKPRHGGHVRRLTSQLSDALDMSDPEAGGRPTETTDRLEWRQALCQYGFTGGRRDGSCFMRYFTDNSFRRSYRSAGRLGRGLNIALTGGGGELFICPYSLAS